MNSHLLFIWGENAPQAFQSLLSPLLTLHAFHLSEVDPREEITQSSRSGGGGVHSVSQTIRVRVTHSGHLVHIVTIWFFNFLSTMKDRFSWAAVASLKTKSVKTMLLNSIKTSVEKLQNQKILAPTGFFRVVHSHIRCFYICDIFGSQESRREEI